MKDVKGKVCSYLKLADDYIGEMHISDMAILKVCLLSFGMALGILVPKRWKRTVVYTSLFVFLVTYLPLMTKFGAYLGRRSED